MNMDEFEKSIKGRMTLANDDPEEGHAWIDDLVEQALRDLVAEPTDPVAQVKGQIVLRLLQLEEHDNWTRWYA